MYATNHFEEIMLNLARGISASAPETMYLALYLNDPGDDGAGTEVSYSGYARQPITFSAPAASGNGYAMQNTAALTFAESSVSVGNVTYVAIMDSLTGGNMYLYGRLEEVLNISAGNAPVVRAGAVKWIWSGKMANAYKIKCMNICRGAQDFLHTLRFATVLLKAAVRNFLAIHTPGQHLYSRPLPNSQEALVL